MYKKVLFGLCCSSMACLSACQESVETESEKLYMSVVARIGEADDMAYGRYAGETVNTATFAEGDRIGLFVDGTPATLWTYGNGWIPEKRVYWADKVNRYVFRAYYPYVEAALPEDVPMPGLLAQDGTMENLSKCDFLVAETEQAYGSNGVVAFTGTGKSFRHVSSLVHLTVRGTDDLAASVLNKITFSGTDIVAPSSYSFAKGKVTCRADGNADRLEAAVGHEMDGKDAEFYFILNAKVADSGGLTLSIDYETGDRNYTAKMENFMGNTLVGGAQQSCTLVIKDSSLSVTGNEINPWGSGEVFGDIIIDVEEKANE